MFIIKLLSRSTAHFVGSIAVAISLAQPAWCQQPVQIQSVQLRSQAEQISPAPAPESLPPVEPDAFSLPELEQLALQANPSVNRMAALVGAARGNWVQVGLLPNPTAGYDGQQLGSGGLAEQHGVLFSQELVRGGKLRLNRAVAEQELTRAQQELAIQQQRVLTDVRLSFYQVLLAQRQIDLTEHLVRISGQGAAAVDALFRGKEATRPDVLQAQLEVENSQVLARNARNRHDSAWRGLAAVVGDPHLPPKPLAGDAYAPPREIDFHEALVRLQGSSPEIASAMTDITRARAALERARVEPVPNVSLQGLVNVVDNGIGGKPDAGVMVSIPIPVFNRNQGTILKAQHEIAAAEQALQQLELSLLGRLAPTYERYANARNQVERYRAAILPAAQESLDITRKMYEVGEANFLSLLTAQRTFSQTNLNYLEALRELRTAEVEIDGMLLSNSLQGR
jgi:cobalt-zinc-cadmium efflux system outer membrane protein